MERSHRRSIFLNRHLADCFGCSHCHCVCFRRFASRRVIEEPRGAAAAAARAPTRMTDATCLLGKRIFCLFCFFDVIVMRTWRQFNSPLLHRSDQFFSRNLAIAISVNCVHQLRHAILWVLDPTFKECIQDVIFLKISAPLAQQRKQAVQRVDFVRLFLGDSNGHIRGRGVMPHKVPGHFQQLVFRNPTISIYI